MMIQLYLILWLSKKAECAQQLYKSATIEKLQVSVICVIYNTDSCFCTITHLLHQMCSHGIAVGSMQAIPRLRRFRSLDYTTVDPWAKGTVRPQNYNFLPPPSMVKAPGLQPHRPCLNSAQLMDPL